MTEDTLGLVLIIGLTAGYFLGLGLRMIIK